MKITQDLRKYTAPARGSKAWKKIFKKAYRCWTCKWIPKRILSTK